MLLFCLFYGRENCDKWKQGLEGMHTFKKIFYKAFQIKICTNKNKKTKQNKTKQKKKQNKTKKTKKKKSRNFRIEPET
jgi:hypothetical protein